MATGKNLDVLVVGAAEAAIGAARLGATTALINRIDPDSKADHTVELLKQEGVSIKYLAKHKSTQITPVDIASGAPAFQRAHAALVAIDSSVRVVTTAIELATRWGAVTIFSPVAPLRVPDSIYKQCHLINLRPDIAEAFTGIEIEDRHSAHRAAHHLLSRGARAVFIDAKFDGDLLVTRDHELWIPRFIQLPVIDRAVIIEEKAAAFGTYVSEGHDFFHAAIFASAAGNLSASRAGKIESLPLRDEVLELLNAGSKLQTEDVAA